MRKTVLVIFLLLLLSAPGYADEAEVYQSLSNFTRVLDLVERNYVEEVDAEELTNSAIDGMLQALDPYSAYLTPERYRQLEIGTSGEFAGVGMEITLDNGVLTVISPIEGTPAERAGIKPKDRIIAINGESTKGMIVPEAVKLLRGPKGTEVNITISRLGQVKPLDFTLVRDKVVIKSVKSELMANAIGYVKLVQFQEDTSLELAQALEALEQESGGSLNGIVLDLRNNPGGLLSEAIEVVDEFVDSGLIVSVKGRSQSQTRDYYATKNNKFQSHPLVVIVNDGSASASEVVAEALQDNKRAMIVGTTTFGKGSVQTIIKLDDGSGLKLTTAKFYAPSGRSISEVGLTPDIVVNNKGEKDSQLERAIDVLETSTLRESVPKG